MQPIPTPANPANLGPLSVGYYLTTPEFRAVIEHTAVYYGQGEAGALVAVVGPAGDPDSQAYARLFSAAPDLLSSLQALLERPNAASSSEIEAARAAVHKALGGKP